MSGALHTMLADNGIRLRRLDPGHTESHLLCPKCDRPKDRQLSVTIDDDGDGARWICHRGTCGWTGGVRVHRDEDTWPPRREKPQPAPKANKPLNGHSWAQQENRPEWLYSFFAARRIGLRVIREFGIYAAPRYFGQLQREAEAIVFPYRHKGIVVGRKYRAREGKIINQEAAEVATLYNADALLALSGNSEVIFVEGELDAMALAECGVSNVVTLRDGAPAEAKFREGDKRFDALRTHADDLAKVARFVLAGDMDGPGLALREELARRLGRHKVALVTWPDGCKDACDVLREHGPQAVLDALTAAAPYPIEGVYRPSATTLLNLRGRPRPATMTTGLASTDRILKLPAEGRLIVLTGVPNHGKSTWARWVMVHTIREHARRWAVFSPEHHPWEEFVASCAEVVVGKPFWPAAGEGMTPTEIGNAGQLLAKSVAIIVADPEKQSPTLEWLLERAVALVLQDGITDFLIDPWNEIEHERGGANETDYIARCLQRLRRFAERHGVNVWIVAHPAKLQRDERKDPPTAYDIAGSANWVNRPDIGLTVWRKDDGTTWLVLWKARYHRWGTFNTTAQMEFDPLTNRYRDPIDLHEPSPGRGAAGREDA